jgi:TRAP-type C4-dicarboxylate transport system permease small subunit
MNKKNPIQAFTSAFHSFEKWSLVLLLSLMIIISILQFVLRIVKLPVSWFGPMLRYTVLWTGMVAAGVATSEHKHIKIDVIGRFARGRMRNLVLFQTNLLAAGVCLFLAWLSIQYIFTIEFNSTAEPPFLNIPSWILLLIMPYGFFTIGVRFLIRTVKKLVSFIKNTEDPNEIEDYSLEETESEKLRDRQPQ